MIPCDVCGILASPFGERMTTFDILCAALDRGDDTALVPLADYLEEMGDTRAAGLRLVGDRRPARAGVLGWVWLEYDGGSATVPASILLRMPEHDKVLTIWRSTIRSQIMQRGYPSRSVAFLALAEALVTCPVM